MMLGIGLSITLRQGTGGGMRAPAITYSGLCFELVVAVDMPPMPAVGQAARACFALATDAPRVTQLGDCFAAFAARPFIAAPTLNQTTDFCFERTIQ